MNKIFCFDYDMTLFDHKTYQIPRSAIEAIASLRKENKIVIASGRSFKDKFNESIITQLKPDAVIHSNGALIEVDDIVLYETTLEEDILEQVLTFAQDNKMCLGTIVGNKWCTTNPEILRKRIEHNSFFDQLDIVGANELKNKKVYALFLNDTAKSAALIEENFPQLRAALMSEEHGADIVPREHSKAAAMEILLKHWNKDFSDVIAFGDSMNDYELIQAAGIGVAMGNAVTRLKAVADYVTTDIGKDGIKNAIDYIKKQS